MHVTNRSESVLNASFKRRRFQLGGRTASVRSEGYWSGGFRETIALGWSCELLVHSQDADRRFLLSSARVSAIRQTGPEGEILLSLFGGRSVACDFVDLAQKAFCTCPVVPLQGSFGHLFAASTTVSRLHINPPNRLY